eukprot:scaffold273994_cov28-Tisochrysis_lutea.AAC.4
MDRLVPVCLGRRYEILKAARSASTSSSLSKRDPGLLIVAASSCDAVPDAFRTTRKAKTSLTLSTWSTSRSNFRSVEVGVLTRPVTLTESRRPSSDGAERIAVRSCSVRIGTSSCASGHTCGRAEWVECSSTSWAC